jgi:hypothetical protein
MKGQIVEEKTECKGQVKAVLPAAMDEEDGKNFFSRSTVATWLMEPVDDSEMRPFRI